MSKFIPDPTATTGYRLESEIDRLRAINAELVAALQLSERTFTTLGYPNAAELCRAALTKAGAA